MTILVVGASGATGRLLVKQLLDRGHNLKLIVRSPDKLPEEVRTHPRAAVIHAGVSELRDAELAAHVNGCEAVASCLGHSISFKGIYGSPRMLVTDTTRRLCEAIRSNQPKQPVRFVLMNTAGNSNRDAPEKFHSLKSASSGLFVCCYRRTATMRALPTISAREWGNAIQRSSGSWFVRTP